MVMMMMMMMMLVSLLQWFFFFASRSSHKMSPSCVFHAHSCAHFLLLFCSWKYNYDDAVLSSVVELHETLAFFLVLFCNQRYNYDDTGFWLYLQARNSDESLLLAGFLVFVPAAPPFLVHQVLLQVLRPVYS
jgi:hypothetical protein